MKEEKEYNEKYGDVPTEYTSRIDNLLQGNFKKYRGNIMPIHDMDEDNCRNEENYEYKVESSGYHYLYDSEGNS